MVIGCPCFAERFLGFLPQIVRPIYSFNLYPLLIWSSTLYACIVATTCLFHAIVGD